MSNKFHSMPFLFALCSLALESNACARRNLGNHSLLRISQEGEKAAMIETAQKISVRCEVAKEKNGQLRTFIAGENFALGKTPRTVSIPDANKAGKTNLNPHPEDAEIFARAGSALQFGTATATGDKVRLFIAQDSRRKMAISSLSAPVKDLLRGVPFAADSLEFLSMVSEEELRTLENDNEDYSSVRKKTKRDFEAMTTLPDGRLLLLSSGSDISKLAKGKTSYRNRAILVDPTTRRMEAFDVSAFYLALQNEKDVVGAETAEGISELNIEGVGVRSTPAGYVISFAHRGNMNGNGHNAIVEFPLDSWMRMLRDYPLIASTEAQSKAPAQKRLQGLQNLKARRIISLPLGNLAATADPKQKSVPFTVTDLLLGSDQNGPLAFLPVTAEAEYYDAQGNHVDGAVIFTGMARWSGLDAPDGGVCTIFQAPREDVPGAVTRFGKLEGIAAFHAAGKTPWERTQYVPGALVMGITDIDSEIQPSQLRKLSLDSMLR